MIALGEQLSNPFKKGLNRTDTRFIDWLQPPDPNSFTFHTGESSECFREPLLSVGLHIRHWWCLLLRYRFLRFLGSLNNYRGCGLIGLYQLWKDKDDKSRSTAHRPENHQPESACARPFELSDAVRFRFNTKRLAGHRRHPTSSLHRVVIKPRLTEWAEADRVA